MPEQEGPVFNQPLAERFLSMVAGLNKDELTEGRVKGLREIAGKNEVAVLDALADRLASSRGRGDEERMRQDLQVAHFLGLDEERENDKLPDPRRELRELRQEYLPEVSSPWSISRDLSGWEFLAFFLGRGYPVEELLGRYNLSKEQVLDYKSALESGDPSVSVDLRWRFEESQLSEEGGNELIRVLDRRYPGRPVSQLNEEEKREVVEEVMPDLARRYPREVLPPNTSEFEPDAGADAEPAAPVQEVPARILKINEALRQADSLTSSVEVSPEEFEEHFRSLSLPGNPKIDVLNSWWDVDRYVLFADLTMALSVSESHSFQVGFDLWFNQTSNGWVSQKAEQDSSLIQAVEHYMESLPANIAESLGGQIEADWEMAGMHVTGQRKLYFDFKKREPEAEAEPLATGLPSDVTVDAGSAPATAGGGTVPPVAEAPAEPADAEPVGSVERLKQDFFEQLGEEQ